MKESQIAGLLTPILAQHGLDLEAVEVVPAGKRRLLRIVVDGDGPEGHGGRCWTTSPRATKALSAALDDSEVVGASLVHLGGLLTRRGPAAGAAPCTGGATSVGWWSVKTRVG